MLIAFVASYFFAVGLTMLGFALAALDVRL
jgi:hypothetical protein